MQFLLDLIYDYSCRNLVARSLREDEL